MTEKRFTIDEDGNITDTINDRCLYVENRMTECDYFVKLLNEQHEDLMTCHSYLSSKTNVENENAELRKENEQLKQELKVYRKVASCSNCHYHNYDWYDDGDEFEVCDKGNDMSDWICVDWEEL